MCHTFLATLTASVAHLWITKLNKQTAMKNILSYIILSAFAAGMASSCRKVDDVPRQSGKQLSDIYATIEGKGGVRLFEPRYSNDTIYFDIPYFYPVDSDNPTDLTKIIVRSTIPADAKMYPQLGEPMDVRQPVNLTVTSGAGETSSYVLAAKHVADVALRTATVTYTENGAQQTIDGVINNATGDVIFYVVPGIDVSSVKLTTTMSPHATPSIANGATLNLTQNVAFTVTGNDGTKKNYTLRSKEPVKLNYGVGISRLLWRKTATDITGFSTADLNRSMAISGNYLVLALSSTPSTYKIYDCKTGAYVQDMVAPPGSLRSFAIANDSAGHILVTSWAPKNAVFYVYKYNDPFDASPVKLIQWTNNNPTGITGDGGVGRRMNVYGDVNKNAILSATAGVSNVTYNWQISNGTLVNNTPTPAAYSSLSGTWSFYAEAQPTSVNANGNYFVNYAAEIALVNGATNSRVAAFTTETPVVGLNHMPMDYFHFNGANYLAVMRFTNAANSKAGMSLFDVTKTSNLSLTSTQAGFSDFRVFASADPNDLTASANGNGAGDICAVLNDDRERICVYMLLTNGGIVGYEFTKYAP
jgi:WD40 repeat protein